MTPTHPSFDGVAGEAIFCTWTGTTPLTPQRAECLLSVYRETHCPVLLLTPANTSSWIKPDAPFHPAFPFLSEVHRADYLRVYLMHHWGGGYTDIKRTSASWRPHFAQLRAAPDAFGLGYSEIGPQGVAHPPDTDGDEMKADAHRLIGNCAYIFRRNTAFTRRWLANTEAALDGKLAALRHHPAQHPADRLGITLPDGSTSQYPLRWAEVLGEIFHPLVHRDRDRFVHAEIAPQFHGYR